MMGRTLTGEFMSMHTAMVVTLALWSASATRNRMRAHSHVAIIEEVFSSVGGIFKMSSGGSLMGCLNVSTAYAAATSAVGDVKSSSAVFTWSALAGQEESELSNSATRARA